MKWTDKPDRFSSDWWWYNKITRQSLFEGNLKSFLAGDLSLKLFRIRTRVNAKYHKDFTYQEDMKSWLDGVDEICIIK